MEGPNTPATNVRRLLVVFQIFRPWTLFPQQIPAETVSADKVLFMCIIVFHSITGQYTSLPSNCRRCAIYLSTWTTPKNMQTSVHLVNKQVEILISKTGALKTIHCHCYWRCFNFKIVKMLL